MAILYIIDVEWLLVEIAAPHEEVRPDSFDDVGKCNEVHAEPDKYVVDLVVLRVIEKDVSDGYVEDNKHRHVHAE